LTQIESGKTISFFNELDIETRTMLITYVSFFNTVATKMKKNYPRKGFHFLTILKSKNFAQRSMFHFFNEVASETQKLSSYVVSFFNELEIKKLCSKTSVSFFNEVALVF
jgi:hypothetical protein